MSLSLSSFSSFSSLARSVGKAIHAFLAISSGHVRLLLLLLLLLRRLLLPSVPRPPLFVSLAVVVAVFK
jgi:hypothetical protein